MTRSTCKTLIRTLLTSVLLFSAPFSLASDWEMSRPAGQLEQASGWFADELRYQRNHGSLSHHARQLSLKAGHLRDSIVRQRSSAFVSAQFNDVRRHYQRLESAFLQSDLGHARSFGRGGPVVSGFDNIAVVYSRLSDVHLYVVPVPYPDTRDRYYSPPRVYRNPPVEIYRFERDDRSHHDDWDHRSSVQERQNRRNDDRHRDSYNRQSETRRDNHYENRQGNNGSYRLGRP